MKLNTIILLGIILLTVGTMLEFFPTPMSKQRVKVNVVANITSKMSTAKFRMNPYTVAIVNLDKSFLGKNVYVKIKSNPNTIIFIALYNEKNNTAEIIRRVSSNNFILYYVNQTEKILIYSPTKQNIEVVVHG